MNAANLELLRRVYESWARGDFTPADAFAPDLEFTLEGPDPVLAHDREGMWRGWSGFLRAWEDFRVEAEEFIPAGEDVVVVFNRLQGRGRSSGVLVDHHAAALWTLRDGRAVRLQLFWEHEAALAAAGLGPGDAARGARSPAP